MNISQTFAKTTGASAEIMRTSSSAFMIFFIRKWQVVVLEISHRLIFSHAFNPELLKLLLLLLLELLVELLSLLVHNLVLNTHLSRVGWKCLR
jgi:hypothetical protein